MEQEGVPSVALIHAPFAKLAHLQAQQLGVANGPFLIYPQDQPSKDPPDLVMTKAQAVARLLPEVLLASSPRPVTLE